MVLIWDLDRGSTEFLEVAGESSDSVRCKYCVVDGGVGGGCGGDGAGASGDERGSERVVGAAWGGVFDGAVVGVERVDDGGVGAVDAAGSGG